MSNPDPTSPAGPTRVGIGLVRRGREFLVRRRPPGGAMPGYWEFPGGKCEGGESPADATARECREEVGVRVIVGPLRRRISHRYAHGWVEMYFFDCSLEDPGREPDPATGFRWCDAGGLASLTFPGANGPILDELAREFPTSTAD